MNLNMNFFMMEIAYKFKLIFQLNFIKQTKSFHPTSSIEIS